ncbi:MAG: hypothetical protein IJO03_00945 [Clostridia bacterium]|nr:hypothetical protein [Clostridia bacterium]
MKTKKLLSILLSVLMLTGIFSVGASAYEPEYEVIDSVDIYNVPCPVAGEELEADGISVPEDANYYIDYSYWKMPGLYTEGYGHDTFESGTIYTLLIKLQAKKGYELAKNLKVTVHGDAAEMISLYYPEFNYIPYTKCDLHLCFHKLTDGGKGYAAPTMKLDIPDVIKANYGEIVDLNTVTENIPNGSNMKWEFSNEDMFENHSSYICPPSGMHLVDNGRQYNILPLESGELTVMATMIYHDYYKNQNICNNGTPISDSKTVRIEVYPSITMLYDATRNYGETHIKYGETFRFSEDFHAAPDGSYLKWESLNGCIELDVSEDTRTCTVKKVRTAGDVLRISLLDAEGKPVTDKDGKPVEHTIKIYTTVSNTGEYISNMISEIFYIISNFFTSLFSFLG